MHFLTGLETWSVQIDLFSVAPSWSLLNKSPHLGSAQLILKADFGRQPTLLLSYGAALGPSEAP